MTRSKDTSSKPVKTTSRDLPAWYSRVFAITLTQDRDPYVEEFDEDLSGLDEDASNDNVSERSYAGSDASYYYELKERREGRKRELFRRKQNAAQQTESERTTVEEVQVAYKKLKKAMRKDSAAAPTLKCLSGKTFDLASPEYAEHSSSAQNINDDDDPKSLALFYHLDEQGAPQDCDKNSPCKRQVYGQIRFDGSQGLQVKHFASPGRASRKSLRVKTSEGSKASIEINFISDDCLQIKVDATHVFGSRPRPKSAPKSFTFSGTEREWKDETAKWALMAAWHKRMKTASKIEMKE